MMMINPAAIRGALAALLEPLVSEGVTLYPQGVANGFAELPGVVLGEFEVEEFEAPSSCLDRYAIAIAIVWPNPGIDDEGTQAGLEAEWIKLASAVRELQNEDPDLGGTVAEWHPVRSEFGGYTVRGIEYPAHVLTLEITG